jgi:hypothetical protein
MATEASLRQPALSTPHHPSESALFSIYSTSTISAPASKVHAILLDSTTYPKWNSFCPRLTMPPDQPKLAVGVRLTEHYYMRGHGKWPPGPQGMEVVNVDDHVSEGTGYRIVFRNTSWPTWLLWSERVQEVRDSGKGCVYVTWDTFGGPLAHVVKLGSSLLVARFWDWADDLKNFAETTDGTQPSTQTHSND